MKIAVDIRHLTRPKQSGVGEYTLQLLRALFEIDETNEYVLFSASTESGKEHVPKFANKNVRWVHATMPNKLLNLRLLHTKRPRLDSLIPDPVDAFFFPNLNYIHINPSIPYALTIHDLSFKIFPHFFPLRARRWHRVIEPERLIKNASGIIVPSKSTAIDVETHYQIPSERIHVIPHGYDEALSGQAGSSDREIRSNLNLPERFAFFLGTIEKRKNIEALIEGVEAYRKISGDDLRLVLAGKVALQTKSWPDFVQILGYIDSKQKGVLYRAAFVTVWPSIYEGFGLPVLESMASGTPVITSFTSSMPEVGGEAAIYIDPYNSNDIAKALLELGKSPELYRDLAQKGLIQAKKFNWKQAAIQTKSVFDALKKSCPQQQSHPHDN